MLAAGEREAVAYHEAGHVLCAELCPTVDKTLHATINPRGQAAGFAVVGRSDRALHTAQHIHEQLIYILGGRAAEHVIYGTVSSGAANDLEKANAIARAAVEQYGLSAAVGQVVATQSGFSEQTKATVDGEVRRIVEEAYRDAIAMVEEHREQLERLTQALLAAGDIDHLEIAAAMEGSTVAPRRPNLQPLPDPEPEFVADVEPDEPPLTRASGSRAAPAPEPRSPRSAPSAPPHAAASPAHRRFTTCSRVVHGGIAVLGPASVGLLGGSRTTSGSSRSSRARRPSTGRTMLVAGVVLAVMILPIITAVTRSVFEQTPRRLQEGALAMGATRWEMIRLTVLPFGKSAIISASMLGLGRALGETMAVAIVLSVSGAVTFNLIGSGNPSTIAAQHRARLPGVLRARGQRADRRRPRPLRRDARRQHGGPRGHQPSDADLR